MKGWMGLMEQDEFDYINKEYYWTEGIWWMIGEQNGGRLRIGKLNGMNGENGFSLCTPVFHLCQIWQIFM